MNDMTDRKLRQRQRAAWKTDLQRTRHASGRWRPNDEQEATGDGVARRLLRLPHVVPRHGRAPAGDRRRGRPGLQPAGRRQGVSRGRRRHAGRRRGQQRRRSAQDQDWSASARRSWSRSAIARSRPTCRACATRSAPRPSTTAPTARTSRSIPAFPTRSCPHCCRTRGRSTSSCRSMSSCPAVRPRPTRFTTS